MNEQTRKSSLLDLNLKEKSHYKVLLALRQDTLSGAELARRTGYRPSTMVYILRNLQEKALIQVCGSGPSTESGGKRPTLWRLNPDYGLIAGMEINAHQIRWIIKDFSGQTRKQDAVEMVSGVSKDVRNEHIAGLIKNRILSAFPRVPCIGMGIAVTGIVNREMGVVHYSRQLELSACPLKEQIEKKLRFPLQIINDANAGALAMKWFPKDHKTYKTIVYFNIYGDTSEFGAGLILNGRLYEGRSGSAGEMMSPLIQRGQLIEKARNAGFAEIESHDMFRLNAYLCFRTLGESVKAKDEGAVFVMNVFFRFLAEEIVRVIAFIDPECLVIGGDICEMNIPLESVLIPKIQEIIQTRFQYGIQLPEVYYSHHRKYTGAVGAAAAVFRQLFNPN